MKRFTIICDYGNRKAPFYVYVGEPSLSRHPLQHQFEWLSRERNGLIPAEAMEGFEKLHAIAKQHHVSLAELSAYAWGGPTTQASNNEKDAFENVRSNFQQFRESREVLVEILSPIGREGDAVPKPTNTFGPVTDTMRRATHPETVRCVFEMGQTLWPLDDEPSRISRLLFLGLGLYIGSSAQRALNLREIYDVLLSPNDVAYSFAVMLDTEGKHLPWLAYSLIAQWLYCEKWLREKTTFHMTTALTEFAMSTKSFSESVDMMRNGLFSALLSGS